MKVKVRGLNSDETYCCQIKDVKNIFNETDVEVYFGTLQMSRNEAENNLNYSPFKDCKDRIVAQMTINKAQTARFYSTKAIYVKFFILKKEGFTQELYDLFVNESLPKMYEYYLKNKDINDNENNFYYKFTIGLINDKYNYYEQIKDRS